MRETKKRRAQEAAAELPQEPGKKMGQELPREKTEAVEAVQGLRREEQRPKLAIGPEELHEATARLKRYQMDKATADMRIVENEQWWRLRHWDYLRQREGVKEKERLEPASAWLLNSIMNKHADAMDNYPMCTVLPREENDKDVARMMTSILPMTLERCNYEETYDRTWWYKLKSGIAATGVFWTPSLENGVGDIEIRKVDVLKLFADMSVNNIQESDHLYCVDVLTMEQLKARWGDKVKDYTGGNDVTVLEFHHDDTREQDDRVMVVDWYYKKQNSNGKNVVHLCKYVGDIVLYATENPPEDGAPDLRERGWYDHGMYPFVVDVLFPVEGSWMGFGYVDVMRDPQMYIDKLDSMILRNAQQCGKKRYFMSTDSGVNKEQFRDWTEDIVDVEGGISEANIKEIDVSPLDENVYETRQNKIEELKETSGNRDFSQGGTTSGVTAASAIAALQEAGSKLSRDMNKAGYRAFRQICEMCVELYRQFYDQPRSFRTTGEHGEMAFVQFDNSRIKPMKLADEFGQVAYRKAVFDLSIKSMRNSPFSRVSQNELAKELYGMGIFNPEMADQALMLLDLMDFEGIEQLKEKISERGTVFEQMQQQIMMLSQQLALVTGQQTAMMQPQGGAAPQQSAQGGQAPLTKAVKSKEQTTATTARDRAQGVASGE